MMDLTPEAIARVLRLGEDTANEFKSTRHGLPRPDDIAQVVVAFANSGGGRLWFGIEDDATVSGVGDRDAADALLRLLDDVCQNNIAPPIACRHVKVEHDARVLIVTQVSGYGPGRPYRTQRGVYYVRGGASVRIASQDEVRRLVLSAAAGAAVPDELPVRGTGLDDLDTVGFQAYYREIYEETTPADQLELERLLVNLRILTAEGLSLMGLLCFGKDPQRALPWARVTAVRAPGTDVGLEMLDRKDFNGTLEQQVQATEQFIARHLASPASIRGFESERPEHVLPLEVVREAVRNAVAHRDYAVAAQINVTVYDDRVEVVSPGRLLNTVSIEAMKLGAVHIERNPLICTVLAKRNLMTERGTGVRRMMIVMKQRGLPEPEFEERGPSLIVTLRMARATP
ncbi:MAG: putative DNA binding domain-containing protein [Candidatus Rokubacteria bacterium]|nr:putative DNA binding domain-containing protein [Candidatus Rokubacteria bacterium]